MSKAPPIPPEEQAKGPQGEERTFSMKAKLKGDNVGRRDATTGLQSKQPGDDDVNLKQQGRQANTWQNTHHQGYQQDR